MILLAAGLTGLELKDGIQFNLEFSKMPSSLATTAALGGLWPMILKAIMALAMLIFPAYVIYMLLDAKRRKRLLFDIILFAVLFAFFSWVQQSIANQQKGVENVLTQLSDGDPGTLYPAPEALPVGPVPTPSDAAITITALIVGAVIVAAVAILWFALRRRAVAQPTVMVQLATSAEETIEMLINGKDLRETILLCYRKMTEITAKNRNLPREISTTPQEFERNLVSKGLPPAPVHDLTSLFEDVRYGDQTVGEEERRRAVNALRVIAAVCREPEQAP